MFANVTCDAMQFYCMVQLVLSCFIGITNPLLGHSLMTFHIRAPAEDIFTQWWYSIAHIHLHKAASRAHN